MDGWMDGWMDGLIDRWVVLTSSILLLTCCSCWLCGRSIATAEFCQVLGSLLYTTQETMVKHQPTVQAFLEVFAVLSWVHEHSLSVLTYSLLLVLYGLCFLFRGLCLVLYHNLYGLCLVYAWCIVVYACCCICSHFRKRKKSWILWISRCSICILRMIAGNNKMILNEQSIDELRSWLCRYLFIF